MKNIKFALIAATLALTATPAQASVILTTDPGEFEAFGPINTLAVDGNQGDQNNYALGDTVVRGPHPQFLQFFQLGEIAGVSRDVLINGFEGPLVIDISGNYQLASFLFGRFNPGVRNQPISVTTNLGTYDFVVPMGTIFSAAPFTFAGFAATGEERITSVTFAGVSPEGFGTSTAIAEIGLGNRGAVSAVPEPSTWMMLIFGFGFIGTALRYKMMRARTRARLA